MAKVRQANGLALSVEPGEEAASLLPALGSASASKGPGQPKKERTSLDLRENCALSRRKHNNLVCVVGCLVLPHSLPPKMLNELEGIWTHRRLQWRVAQGPTAAQGGSLSLPLLDSSYARLLSAYQIPQAHSQTASCLLSPRGLSSAPGGLHGCHLSFQASA